MKTIIKQRLSRELRLRDFAGKRHHLRVLRTRGKLDESKWGPNSVMIKTIISVLELDDDTWRRLEHHVFDERYDGGVICGKNSTRSRDPRDLI